MSDKVINCLLIAIAIISIALCIFLASQQRKWLKKKNEDQIFVYNKRDTVRWNHAIIKMLEEFVFTRHFIKRIKRRYEIIEPGDVKKIEKDTLKVFFVSFIINIILLTVFLIMGFAVYTAVSMVLLAYVANTYVVFKSVRKKEMLLLKQTSNFITEVRHQYYSASGSILDALYEALIDAPHPIDIHMEHIYNILTSNDIEEEMNIYNEQAPNRFLKMFLSICVTIIRFDDKEVNGRSLFIENLSHLKQSIEGEIRKIDNLNYKLGGLALWSAGPIAVLRPIEKWSINNTPEVEHYYTGAYGVITFTIICVVSIIIYNLILNMHQIEFQNNSDHAYLNLLMNKAPVRNAINFIKYRNYGKVLKYDEMLHRLGENLTVEQLYLKRFLYAFMMTVITFSMSMFIHHNNRDYILNTQTDIDATQIIVSINDSVVQEMKDLVVEIANAYKDDKNIDLSGLKAFIKSQNVFTRDTYIEFVANAAYEKIIRFRNDYYRWYELLITLVLSALGYHIPILSMSYRKRKLEMNMENEVVQFHSIIILLMHLDRVTSLDILKWMENFAYIFKPSISECIDDLPNGEKEALEKLKEKEPYPAFQKIVDHMLDADRIGVRLAFDEVEADRKNFSEKRKQDDDIFISSTSAAAGFFAFIPISAVILLYMCGPLLIEAMSQFSKYSNEMAGMM